MPAAFGTDGRPVDAGNSFTVTFVYGEATPLDNCFWVAPRAARLLKAVLRPLVVGSDGGAVTSTINKAGAGTAIASGTAMTGAGDLKGTINTTQTLALSATTANLSIAAGEGVGMDTTGTMTAARGVVTLEMAWM